MRWLIHFPALSYAAVLSLGAGLGNLSAAPAPLRVEAIQITGELGGFTPKWQMSSPAEDIHLATLTLESPGAAVLPPIQIEWSIPAVGIAGQWLAEPTKDKSDYERVKVESCAVQRAPLLTYVDASDRNRFTVALSDALRPAVLSSGLKEEDGRLYLKLALFEKPQPPQKIYQVTLRFDSRAERYETVLRDTVRWWAEQPGYTPAPVPEAARVPVYSTWYSHHQQLDADQLVGECRIGGTLGLHGIIVDDGWQTLDNNRGYAFTGDWKPDRFPDMKGFVERIHALGQKAWLWYSVPMVGKNSQAAKRFEGKTLDYSNGLQAHVLDPRYPEVREHLIGLYEQAVRDWGYDGLKLDFLEMLAAKPNTVLTAENGRDIASVDEAVDRLLSDVMTRLRKIKPDVAIEFRQPYNGPLMRKYGNMLRAVDCPNIASVNRQHIVDLRLLADHTAVHSDMIMWHPDESVEGAALQILNILYSVPQISVRLDRISGEHRTMIAFWMGYWKDNRSVLLDGEFRAASPTHNYPVVSARTKDKLIATIYQDIVVQPGAGAPPAIDVVNATRSRQAVVHFAEAYGAAKVRVLDVCGKVVSDKPLEIAAGPLALDVPPSGLVEIRKSAR